MDEFDPAPERDAGDRRPWPDGADTFDRVYDVALGVTDPTPYADVAELADCSPNAAKKHLDRLAEMGIVRADRESRPARYVRDDGYLEWQEASRIARELSVEGILERVSELETERERYEERFDATDPRTVSAFDAENHGSVHDRMEVLAEWQGIVRDLRLYELARRLAQNDGHVVSA